MRKIIAAMQTSVDGFIEGPNGELDWIENWEDSYDLMSQVDTCVLGGGMYPGYEQYWRAILANPEGVLTLTGQVATRGEVDYAHFADSTPHIVLSRTLQIPDWDVARVIRDIDDIWKLKEQPGKDIYAVGGAMLVSSLINLGLIDELRLTMHPVVLGGGKALFRGVHQRQSLRFVQATTRADGVVGLNYETT